MHRGTELSNIPECSEAALTSPLLSSLWNCDNKIFQSWCLSAGMSERSALFIYFFHDTYINITATALHSLGVSNLRLRVVSCELKQLGNVCNLLSRIAADLNGKQANSRWTGRGVHPIAPSTAVYHLEGCTSLPVSIVWAAASSITLFTSQIFVLLPWWSSVLDSLTLVLPRSLLRTTLCKLRAPLPYFTWGKEKIKTCSGLTPYRTG